MAEIRVDVEGLLSNKRAIEQKISELQSLNMRLEQLIHRIGDSWEGEASERYIEKMLGYKVKAEEMVAVLEEFKKYMEQAANTFAQKDRDGANRIRSC